jgi:LysR family transcriptional regulator, nitrogen assimilation regulatory protein
VQLDVEPRIVAQANSMTLQTLLVEAGHGWTILPPSGVATDVAKGRLSAAPLRNPSISRTVGLGLPRTGHLPPAGEAVATELLVLIRSTVHSGHWVAAEFLREELADSTNVSLDN